MSSAAGTPLPATSAMTTPSVAADLDEVEAIAADAVRRLPGGRNLKAGNLRQRGRQQRALNQPRFFLFAPLFAILPPCRTAIRDFALDDLEQGDVLPRFLHEALRAAPHRFDGGVDVAPPGHDDDRKGRIVRADLRDQLEAFTARCGVAGVVEIHQQQVECVGAEPLGDAVGRSSRTAHRSPRRRAASAAPRARRADRRRRARVRSVYLVFRPSELRRKMSHRLGSRRPMSVPGVARRNMRVSGRYQRQLSRARDSRSRVRDDRAHTQLSARRFRLTEQRGFTCGTERARCTRTKDVERKSRPDPGRRRSSRHAGRAHPAAERRGLRASSPRDRRPRSSRSSKAPTSTSRFSTSITRATPRPARKGST